MLARLDMRYSAVYIAALPGKKAAGVCRIKRVTTAGRYRIKISSTFSNSKLHPRQLIFPTTPGSHKEGPLKYCLTFIDTCDDC